MSTTKEANLIKISSIEERSSYCAGRYRPEISPIITKVHLKISAVILQLYIYRAAIPMFGAAIAVDIASMGRIPIDFKGVCGRLRASQGGWK